uniref:tRNA N(3)-cytidine methyltransferase METTL6 n=1 Tax=Leptobrachium leishanense TaxID=445787 RepID=A0A8C5Q0X6_9ANUR
MLHVAECDVLKMAAAMKQVTMPYSKMAAASNAYMDTTAEDNRYRTSTENQCDSESLCRETPFQTKQDQVRILTLEEATKLENDSDLVSEFKQLKLEREAQKNWDLFYKRNTTNFFKDRHWTTREFEELKACRQFEDQRLNVLEAGCGVGNCLFPLVEEDPRLFIYACDFSPRAIEFVKQNPAYSEETCKAFQCDLTKDDLRNNVAADSVDVATLIFVLSAIHPDNMHHAVKNIYKVLKPGGCVLFRDYGLHDYAMLRFKSGSKLGDNFYVRQDGTRSYFFTKEYLLQLFSAAGYEEVSNEYVFRETVNKKEGLCVPRVFLQKRWTDICLKQILIMFYLLPTMMGKTGIAKNPKYLKLYNHQRALLLLASIRICDP